LVHAAHMLRGEGRNSASATRTATSSSQTLPSVVVLDE